MSISPVGNSDAYERYRQQALNLLASPGKTETPETTTLSFAVPPNTEDESSSNPFATKFKTDLSTLNSAHDGKSHTHGAHGHHHKADAATAPDNAADPSATASSTDPVGQTIDEFANLLKTAVGIAAIIA